MSLLQTAQAEAERRAKGWRDRLTGAVADNRHQLEAKCLADARLWSRIIWHLGGPVELWLPRDHRAARDPAVLDLLVKQIAAETADDWARMVQTARTTLSACLEAAERNPALADHARALSTLHHHLRARAVAITARLTPHEPERNAA